MRSARAQHRPRAGTRLRAILLSSQDHLAYPLHHCAPSQAREGEEDDPREGGREVREHESTQARRAQTHAQARERPRQTGSHPGRGRRPLARTRSTGEANPRKDPRRTQVQSAAPRRQRRNGHRPDRPALLDRRPFRHHILLAAALARLPGHLVLLTAAERRRDQLQRQSQVCRTGRPAPARKRFQAGSHRGRLVLDLLRKPQPAQPGSSAVPRRTTHRAAQARAAAAHRPAGLHRQPGAVEARRA